MPILPTLPANDVQQFSIPYDEKGNPIAEDQQGHVKMDVSEYNVQDSLTAELGDTLGRVSLRIVASRIKEWDFTEANSQAIPITYDNVMRLGMSNLDFLARQIRQSSQEPMGTEEKKS